MSKTIKSVLLLCFILSGAISHAHGAARTEKENEEGVPISIILKTQHGGTDKSGSIVSSIDGHYLTVVFTENLGQVAIEITTSTAERCETKCFILRKSSDSTLVNDSPVSRSSVSKQYAV